MSDECTHCGCQMRPLFTSMYCSNERCGKPPASSDWRRMLPKIPEFSRLKAEQRGSTWGGVIWYVYEIAMYVGSMWVVSRQLRYDDLVRSTVAFRVNPDGFLNVIKNRNGDCHISSVPDA